MTTNVSPAELAIIQRRTRWVLALSVGPAGMGIAGGFAATSLAAEDITGSDSLATLAATMITIGAAMTAVPLSRYMARQGRRPGLRIGWIIATGGAALAFVAVLLEIYPLLLLGALAIGIGNGTNLSARYAAADLADDSKKARAIGVLVWASSIGSVLGPTVALGPTGALAESVGLPRLSGPYLLGTLVFATAATIVHRKLDPDPLLLAAELGDVVDTPRPSLAQSFAAIAHHPGAVLAVAAMAVGHSVMVAIMTVTPLHMTDGEHKTQIIGFVISLHIVGMYFFAPIVGWLVDHLPTAAMVAAAGVILFAGSELASHTRPQDSLGVFSGLLLIGVGWSFAMIAGSALFTSAFPVHERTSVQGAADFTMVFSGALAGLASGVIVEWTSYGDLSHWAGVGALGLVAAALFSAISQSRSSRPPLPPRQFLPAATTASDGHQREQTGSQ